MNNPNIWLVEFPTFQYKEDVKALATKNGLRLIDARYVKEINPQLIAKEVPTITKKTAAQIKKEAAKVEIEGK